MVKSEEIVVGSYIQMIGKPHVRGIVGRLRPLGQKNWFKLDLESGQSIVVQKPEEWEFIKKR